VRSGGAKRLKHHVVYRFDGVLSIATSHKNATSYYCYSNVFTSNECTRLNVNTPIAAISNQYFITGTVQDTDLPCGTLINPITYPDNRDPDSSFYNSHFPRPREHKSTSFIATIRNTDRRSRSGRICTLVFRKGVERAGLSKSLG
jgi:hypothetical protein